MAFTGRVIALVALIVLGFVLFAYADESSTETVAEVEDVNGEQELLENASAEEIEGTTWPRLIPASPIDLALPSLPASFSLLFANFLHSYILRPL